jgi:hypothetical protein
LVTIGSPLYHHFAGNAATAGRPSTVSGHRSLGLSENRKADDDADNDKAFHYYFRSLVGQRRLA